MKKTILSILAGAFISTSALALEPIDGSKLILPTGDQKISDIYDNIQSGINNNTLSPYEQAWMIVHDKKVMFKHKTFWTRVGTTFIPHNVEKLADMNSSDRAKMIKETIIKEIVVEKIKVVIEEKIIEDTSKIKALEAQVKAKEAVIDSIRSRAKSDLDSLRTELEGQIAIKNKIINNLKVNLNQAKADLAIFKELAANSGLSQADVEYRISVGKQSALEMLDSKAEEAIAKVEAVQNVPTEIVDIPNRRDVFALGTSLRRNSIDDIKVEVRDLDGNTIEEIRVDYNFDGVREALAFVADHAFEQGFQEGYTQGFDDGYDQGYADGYKDGFADGVASVN